MKYEIGSNYLVTCDSWFLAPDGRQYKAVFGELKGIEQAKDVFGFSPLRSANWFMHIGNVHIAGCQIHYAVKTDFCSSEEAENWSADAATGITKYKHPSMIYFAD